MSRSNTKSGSVRRQHAGSRTMNRLLQCDAGRPRGRKVAKRAHQAELDYDQDGMAGIPGDVDVILDRYTAHDLQDTETRRRIEMLREEWWLQQELSDIYDS